MNESSKRRDLKKQRENISPWPPIIALSTYAVMLLIAAIVAIVHYL